MYLIYTIFVIAPLPQKKEEEKERRKTEKYFSEATLILYK